MTDYSIIHVDLSKNGDGGKEDIITEKVIKKIRAYETKHFCKIIGAGIPRELCKHTPTLASKLWLDLDIVPLTLSSTREVVGIEGKVFWDDKSVDEQAESMARKCVLLVYLLVVSQY